MTQFIIWAFCALVVLAAAQDLWKLKISNFFPVGLVALFGLWLGVVGLEADIWKNAVLFAGFLGVGTLLFAKGWFGGGDVKLLAAIALWFDFDGGLALFIWTTIGGGFLALLFIALRRMLPLPAAGAEGGWAAFKRKGPIPYGLAIAAGAILCAQTNGFNPSGRFDLGTLKLPTVVE